MTSLQNASSRPEFMIDGWDFTQHPATEINADFHQRQLAWFHFQRDAADLPQWLAQAGIPEPLVDAVLTEDTRPRFDKVEGGFLLILRGVNLTETDQPEDMLSLRILYYNNAIYSFRKRPFKALQVIRDKLHEGQGPETLHDLLVMIIEQLNARIEELLDVAEESLEVLEFEDITDTSTSQQQLTKLHRRLLRLNRFIRPQVAALERLAAESGKWMEPELQQWLLNERDTTQRLLESLDMMLEQIWMLREHLQQAVAEKMNRNTYWLSVIAGVFLPISFLTGVFGINIGGMPGVDDASAFWIFCGVLSAIAVVEFLLLRRLRFW